ncbi:energy transducer TonB [Pinirhizobacter sp.]|jgi:protein TonB|uniref:energy transducer TonB n=1 Tax=Pinirhizobacter sp. TaxID=2950432 RepID=UPI002F41849E
MTTRGSQGTDLFGPTLLFSIVLHGIILLGVTFSASRPKAGLPSLDVTLVDVANDQAPDKADFLAQANNAGGGESEKAARPSERASGLLPTDAHGTAPTRVAATTANPTPASDPRLVTTEGSSDFTVTRNQASTRQDDQASAEETRRAEEMAALAAEVRDQSEKYAKRPKKKFISANTKEYAYAAYMNGWVKRVERVGNQNYPDQARRESLHGDVVLTVGLNRDGSIKSVDVIESSGHKLLDDAAQRIVRLAGPFPALPPDKTRVDELYITRTWQFLPGDILRNR